MRNVLVVDNNEELLEAMEELIEYYGCNVTVAISYESLIKTFEEYFPDLILLDIILDNGEDGRVICKMLKEDPKTAGIIIILISGYPDKLTGFKEYKADGILNKPIDMNKFHEILEKYNLGSNI